MRARLPSPRCLGRWLPLLLALLPTPAASAPPRVVVFELEGRGVGLDAASRQRLTERLAERLAQIHGYHVVPRADLQRQLREARGEQPCPAACQAEIGKTLGAKMSLSTQLLRLKDKCVLTAVLSDLADENERTARVEGACDEASALRLVIAVAHQLRPPFNRLAALARQPRFSVRISSTPSGARVTLDGRRWGRTPVFLRLKKGTHELALARAGYAPVHARLEVRMALRKRFTLRQTAEGRAAMRTRSEWASLEFLGGGILDDPKLDSQGTTGAALSIVTLKWRWVFWSILELGGTGGEDIGSTFILTRLGLPLYFGDKGTHQLRFGLGGGPGFVGSEGDGGVLLSPTAHYYRQGEAFFIGAGLRLLVPVTGDLRRTRRDAFGRTSAESYHPVAVMFSLHVGVLGKPH